MDAPPEGAATAKAGERRLRYPLLWLAFVACMITGAALLSNRSPTVQMAGVALLGGPLAALLLLAAAYYLLERFRAGR